MDTVKLHRKGNIWSMFLEINNGTESMYEDEIEDDIELYSSTGIIDKAPIITIFNTIAKTTI